MAEEKLICVNCGGEVRTDIEQAEDAYWCDGCNHFVPVVLEAKPRSPCSLCHGTGEMPSHHDMDEFYKEDPKPMKCPNCGGPLEEGETISPIWVILGEIPHGEEAMYHRGTDVRTLHKCPHCHCIVLRCEK